VRRRVRGFPSSIVQLDAALVPHSLDHHVKDARGVARGAPQAAAQVRQRMGPVQTNAAASAVGALVHPCRPARPCGPLACDVQAVYVAVSDRVFEGLRERVYARGAVIVAV
jgi:hypothetical protein